MPSSRVKLLRSRSVRASEKFEQEDADGASVEIAEGMDREEAAFGEGEQFEQRV